jgi:hypothetical protein
VFNSVTLTAEEQVEDQAAVSQSIF